MTRKSSAKPNKSDRTRAAILNAAREVFSERGYDAATIRTIAAQASIDPAMVIRYFGTKDELFARAAAIDLALPDLRSVDTTKIGETLIRHFLTIWEDAGGHGMAIMLRSAASNDFAAQKVREVFAAQVGATIAAVGKRDTAERRAGLVASQLLGLALCRYVLRIPPVVAMSREDIVAQIGPTLQRYATG
ncbi:TetR family transcriptional regulator [Pseudorhodoplanes sp.]|uniref:TetR/AcrR family transcriptional regulator n=1 Tax=Pseudorhodoplanes sp. TaxID=1934341 RepID=UPI003D11CF74